MEMLQQQQPMLLPEYKSPNPADDSDSDMSEDSAGDNRKRLLCVHARTLASFSIHGWERQEAMKS